MFGLCTARLGITRAASNPSLSQGRKGRHQNQKPADERVAKGIKANPGQSGGCQEILQKLEVGCLFATTVPTIRFPNSAPFIGVHLFRTHGSREICEPRDTSNDKCRNAFGCQIVVAVWWRI
jgi:hypothetical protein